MHQPPQRNVRSRTTETLGAGQFNRRHSQPLNVPWMTNRSHCNPIVDLENFLPRFAESEKQNAVEIAERRDRTARSELRFNVLAAIRVSYENTIRLFDTATISLYQVTIL